MDSPLTDPYKKHKYAVGEERRIYVKPVGTVHKAITKYEKVKELNFICELKYYTFILGGFRANSYLFIGVSQI